MFLEWPSFRLFWGPIHVRPCSRPCVHLVGIYLSCIWVCIFWSNVGFCYLDFGTCTSTILTYPWNRTVYDRCIHVVPKWEKIKRARSSGEWLSLMKVRFFSRAQNIRSKSMKLPCRQQRHHYPCLAFWDQGSRNQSRLRRQQQVRKYRIISFFRILIFQFWIGIFKRTCGACYLLTSQQSMNNLNNLERDQVVDSWKIQQMINYNDNYY